MYGRPIIQISDDLSDVFGPVDFLIPPVNMPAEEITDDDSDEEYFPPEYNRTAYEVRSYFRRTENCLTDCWKLWQFGIHERFYGKSRKVAAGRKMFV